MYTTDALRPAEGRLKQTPIPIRSFIRAPSLSITFVLNHRRFAVKYASHMLFFSREKSNRRLLCKPTLGCNDNFFCSVRELQKTQSSTAASLVKRVGSWIVHASTKSEGICIEHWVVRINHMWDRRICAGFTFASLLLVALRQVLLLLILRRHLLLARRWHLARLGRLGRLLVAEALSRRWMCRIVLLRVVVAVQIMCIEVVVIAGLVGIGVVLVEHGVRSVRGIVFLFCVRVSAWI